MRTIGILALIAAAMAALAVVAVLGFGAYNVSATEPHWRATVWVLDTAMRSSARQRSRDIVVPPDLDSRGVEEGADIYRVHCAACHGAPGVAPDPFALGLVPLPANLAHAARAWPPQELYWVVKNGIKMTAMPAWAFRLSDEQIWSVVAFLPRLAHLTPAEYAKLDRPPAQVDDDRVAVRSAPDPSRGWEAVHQYGCPTCHHVPEVSASTAPVGPTLHGIGVRTYIAGRLPNTQANMVRWLLDPPAVNPDTAMPALGLSERDAADIAAYLATLRR
jgi:mono/diheme cytochrome c family protein